MVHQKSSNYFVYLVVIAVNLITFAAGGSFTWTSPILTKLRSTDPTINPLSQPITMLEQTWIIAILYVGAMLGPVVGGVCSEKFGKKKTLLTLGVPMVISHLICAFADNIHHFLAARVLIGIGVGTVFGVVPGYVGDIAEDRNRGVLGSVLGVTSCSGGLFMYMVGPFLSLRIISLINLIPMILFYALFGYCIPGSPYDLVKQGDHKAAKESLIRLRNSISGIEKEFASIIDTVEANKQSVGNVTLYFFKSKGLTKGLIISNSLMFFQQFSGTGAVIGYMQIIFDAAGNSIPSIYSVMILGVVQLVANIASAQLVDRAGRKMLLIVSYIFSMISLVTLGAYFYLQDSGENVDKISWLPIASLIVYITAFNLGLGNLPWVLLAELFPANIKALASTITSVFVFSLSFLITMCFPYVSAAFGMAGSFWIFAAFLAAGFTFTVIFVPETKGKSIQEIQNILEGVQK